MSTSTKNSELTLRILIAKIINAFIFKGPSWTFALFLRLAFGIIAAFGIALIQAVKSGNP